VYISFNLLVESAIVENKLILWFTTNGIIEKITINNTNKIIKNIKIIQNKSFILYLFNLFKKGENSSVKKRENTKIKIILEILYKKNIQIITHNTINIFIKKFL
jgi:hypothetical protein